MNLTSKRNLNNKRQIFINMSEIIYKCFGKIIFRFIYFKIYKILIEPVITYGRKMWSRDDRKI